MTAILLTLFLAASVGDCATTLRAPGWEANPILGSLVQHPAAFVGVKMGVSAGLAALVWHDRRAHPRRALIMAAVLAGAESALLISNWRQMQRR